VGLCLGLEENRGKKSAKSRRIFENIGKITVFNNVTYKATKPSKLPFICNNKAASKLSIFSIKIPLRNESFCQMIKCELNVGINE